MLADFAEQTGMRVEQCAYDIANLTLQSLKTPYFLLPHCTCTAICAPVLRVPTAQTDDVEHIGLVPSVAPPGSACTGSAIQLGIIDLLWPQYQTTNHR